MVRHSYNLCSLLCESSQSTFSTDFKFGYVNWPLLLVWTGCSKDYRITKMFPQDNKMFRLRVNTGDHFLGALSPWCQGCWEPTTKFSFGEHLHAIQTQPKHYMKTGNKTSPYLVTLRIKRTPDIKTNPPPQSDISAWHACDCLVKLVLYFQLVRRIL